MRVCMSLSLVSHPYACTAVAAIVRSGLTDASAYALPWAGHPAGSAWESPLASEAFGRSCQSRHPPPRAAAVPDSFASGDSGSCYGQEQRRRRPGGGGRGRRRGCSPPSSVGALGAVGSALDIDVDFRVVGGPAVAEETAAAAAGRKAKQQLRALTRGLNSITAYAAYG